LDPYWEAGGGFGMDKDREKLLEDRVMELEGLIREYQGAVSGDYVILDGEPVSVEAYRVQKDRLSAAEAEAA